MNTPPGEIRDAFRTLSTARHAPLRCAQRTHAPAGSCSSPATSWRSPTGRPRTARWHQSRAGRRAPPRSRSPGAWAARAARRAHRSVAARLVRGARAGRRVGRCRCRPKPQPAPARRSGALRAAGLRPRSPRSRRASGSFPASTSARSRRLRAGGLAARVVRRAAGGTRDPPRAAALDRSAPPCATCSRRTAHRGAAAPRHRAGGPSRRGRALARLDGLASWRRSAARTRLALAALWFAAGCVAGSRPRPRSRVGRSPTPRSRAARHASGRGRSRARAPTAVGAAALPPARWRTRGARAPARVTAILAAISLLDALLAWSLPPLARVAVVLTFLPSGVAMPCWA